MAKSDKFPGYIIGSFKSLISGDETANWEDADLIRCPVCKENNTHTCNTAFVQSDDYEAWEGRGSCLYINMHCECGHRFQIGLGFHKGETRIFSRHLELESNEKFIDTRNASSDNCK